MTTAGAQSIIQVVVPDYCRPLSAPPVEPAAAVCSQPTRRILQLAVHLPPILLNPQNHTAERQFSIHPIKLAVSHGRLANSGPIKWLCTA